ncbi:hypothetical protein OE749_09130 [Aestuariibacter sp. AA17]|uniref:Uncharacterized protein n=2 Tax=Fluctibacter corallii TaxID=2984329 RepID=A0ABT3A9A5_9ALTE|nr:hypothetical protein [Aestuariibacter sp. AA17]
MEAQDYDEQKASAMRLASDTHSIASSESLTSIVEQLFSNDANVDNLILDISRAAEIEYSDAEDLLTIIIKQLNLS